jgi:hypothetical protein
MIRQGAEFPPTEIKRLAMGNERWQAMEKHEMIFTFRNRFYSEPVSLPTYGDGRQVGKITYNDDTGRMRVNDLPIDEVIDSYKKPSRQHTISEE